MLSKDHFMGPMGLQRWVLSALLLFSTLTAHSQPLRWALPTIPSNSLALLAALSAGPGVQMVPCLNGDDCLQKLIRGEADLANGSDTSMVMAYRAGAQPDVIATVAESRLSNRLIVRKAAGLNTPADLRGRRIGYLRATSSHYFTEAFLAFHGITPDEVTLVELDPARPSEPLIDGTVDAAGLYPPHSHRALIQLSDRAFEFRSPPVYSLTVNLLAQRGLSNDRLRPVIRALIDAERRMRDQPDESWSAVGKQLNLSAVEVERARLEFRFAVRLDQSLIDSLESQLRWASRRLGASTASEVNVLPMFRVDVLRAIDPTRVTVVK